MPRHPLPKAYILRGKRPFNHIFEHGSSLRAGVLKFLFCTDISPDWVQEPISVAFSAPKRRFRRAVDRNYLKRRMREAYRLQQHLLMPPSEDAAPLIVFIMYTSGRRVPFEVIMKSMTEGLNLVQKKAYGNHVDS